jgi:hypothetical protein
MPHNFKPFDDGSTGARTSHVQVEMNVGWMRNNPELAVEGIVDFYNKYNEEEWTYRVRPTFVPPSRSLLRLADPEFEQEYSHLGYIQLEAIRKDSE